MPLGKIYPILSCRSWGRSQEKLEAVAWSNPLAVGSDERWVHSRLGQLCPVFLKLFLQAKDLLELMLRAEITDSEGRQVSKLSDEEVLAQSITFILAGYDTTSNTLAYTTYCLAMNPDVQENLIKEIDFAIGDNVSTIFNRYLIMVMTELSPAWSVIVGVINQ